ncbi:hypothetical protein ACVME5_006177 [Bradyrhizobium liaoningense]
MRAGPCEKPIGVPIASGKKIHLAKAVLCSIEPTRIAPLLRKAHHFLTYGDRFDRCPVEVLCSRHDRHGSDLPADVVDRIGTALGLLAEVQPFGNLAGCDERRTRLDANIHGIRLPRGNRRCHIQRTHRGLEIVSRIGKCRPRQASSRRRPAIRERLAPILRPRGVIAELVGIVGTAFAALQDRKNARMNVFAHLFDHRVVGDLPDHFMPELQRILQFAIDPDQQLGAIQRGEATL